MKKVIEILKIAIPLGLGFFVIWWEFSKLSPDQKTELFDAIRHSTKFWLAISMVIGIFSHVSRAHRWGFALNQLGYKTSFRNKFYAVMIGNFTNLFLPRVGELSRCLVLAKYEKVPVDKSFGTVIAERIADVIMLGLIISLILFREYDLLETKLLEMTGGSSADLANKLIFLGILGVGGLLALFILYKAFPRNTLVQKISAFLIGMKEGVYSIFKMEKKAWFIFHTLLIWTMYIAMIYIGIFCIDEISTASFWSVLSSFAIGGISIVFVPGGIGVYPSLVKETMMLYGFPEVQSLAFGWLVWTAQTLMLIIGGVFAWIAIPFYNKKRNNETLGKNA